LDLQREEEMPMQPAGHSARCTARTGRRSLSQYVELALEAHIEAVQAKPKTKS